MALKFYTSVAKGLKLKVRKFFFFGGGRGREVLPTFIEITGGKSWCGEPFVPPILNMVK